MEEAEYYELPRYNVKQAYIVVVTVCILFKHVLNLLSQLSGSRCDFIFVFLLHRRLYRFKIRLGGVLNFHSTNTTWLATCEQACRGLSLNLSLYVLLPLSFLTGRFSFSRFVSLTVLCFLFFIVHYLRHTVSFRSFIFFPCILSYLRTLSSHSSCCCLVSCSNFISFAILFRLSTLLFQLKSDIIQWRI